MTTTYDPRADDKQYVLTGMLDNIENGAIGTWDWIQKQAQDDPDRWDDDVLRLLGGGLKNTAWAISKIPLINKLAEGEDWLAHQARKMNETLTPWLDPRVAGWGTRIGTGILADKGISKATGAVTKGVRAYKAVSKADEIMALAKQQDFGLQMKGVSERMAAATTLKNSEIRRLGKELLYDLQHPVTKIPDLKRTTPQTRYRQIFNDDPNYKYPSIEDLDLATRNTQFENPRINWEKERLKYTPTPDTRWTAIGKRLQKEYGGSDEFVEGFVKRQKETVATTRAEVDWLNEQMPLEYLQFVLADTVGEGVELPTIFQGKRNFRMSYSQRDKLVYDLAERLSDEKGVDFFHYGHEQSAKNIAAATPPGVVTTADFATNVRPEIAHSLRDFFVLNTKGKNFKKIVNGKQLPTASDFQIIEPGNIARGRRQDMNDFVNIFLGRSPNVEFEYVKALGDWGTAMNNIIPVTLHEHFIEYLRKGIRKWQGSEKGGLKGSYQLRFYPREIRKLTDDYMNALDAGKFRESGIDTSRLSKRARADAEIDQAIDTGIGETAISDELARQRDVVRREMPESLKNQFENPEK